MAEATSSAAADTDSDIFEHVFVVAYLSQLVANRHRRAHVSTRNASSFIFPEKEKKSGQA